MKILVLGGSPRLKDSYKICEMIRSKLCEQGTEEVQFEYIRLSKLDIGECRGCELCLTNGERYCPLKDELESLVAKMKAADGFIFASPVYACQITASFKKVVDRLSYLFHRPEFVGKPVLTVVTSAGGGIKPTQKYLKLTACGWGCSLIGELVVVSTRYFENSWAGREDQGYKNKVNGQIEQYAVRFRKALEAAQKGVFSKPSFYEIYSFHGLKSKTYISQVDYEFWKEKGWLKKYYYYDTKLPLGGKLLGKGMDWLVKQMAGKMGLLR